MTFQFLTVSKRAILVPGITDSLRCNCPQVKVTVFLFHYSVHCVEFACYVIVGWTINSNVGIAILQIFLFNILAVWLLCCFWKKKLTDFFQGLNSQELHGLYIQAFCTGLDEILDSYRNALIDLEKQVIFFLLLIYWQGVHHLMFALFFNLADTKGS